MPTFGARLCWLCPAATIFPLSRFALTILYTPRLYFNFPLLGTLISYLTITLLSTHFWEIIFIICFFLLQKWENYDIFKTLEGKQYGKNSR